MHDLRPIFPTRWVMNLPSVDNFLQHYSTVLEQLEINQTDRQLTSENRADAWSYFLAMEVFDTYFGLCIFRKLLFITNSVILQCQGRWVTVCDVRSLVTTLFPFCWVNFWKKDCYPLLTRSKPGITLSDDWPTTGSTYSAL